MARAKQILLIEDSKFMRVAMEQVLSKAGYRVSSATGGEQGTKMVRKIRPDLVLLSAILPTGSGLEVLRTLKKDPVTRSTPVVIVTAASSVDRQTFLKEGATYYLEKSGDLLNNQAAVLIETIARVLHTP